MEPEEARKVQLAARIIASRLQDDRIELEDLIQRYSPQGVQDATDGLILLAYPCAGVLSDLTSRSVDDVLATVPRLDAQFLSDPIEQWSEVIRLIRKLKEGQSPNPQNIDIPEALKTAFNVAFSLVMHLSDVSGNDPEYLASLMSETAQREM